MLVVDTYGPDPPQFMPSPPQICNRPHFLALPYVSLNASLNGRMDRIEVRLDRIEAHLTSVKERLSRIEGWIAGRFREETAPSA